VTAQLASGLYAISDDSLAGGIVLEVSGRILQAGVSAMQFRDKSRNSTAKTERAAALQALCRKFRTPFIVNDDLDLAVALRADGVHLGRDDDTCAAARARLGSSSIIGISCYDDPQRAVAAQHDGADYVAFGAFHPTATKTASTRATPDLLRRVRPALRIPIVAIGGITPDNGAALLAAGANLLAVVGALYRAADAVAAVRAFRALFALQAQQSENGKR
jgi:thiamine-phosphate pyrophosphorylase